jgi:site-specific recombinase XerD
MHGCDHGPKLDPGMEPPAAIRAQKSSPARLLDRVRARIRYRHYSDRTEQAYVEWVRRLVRFHGRMHPMEIGAPEIEAFLNHLANERDVAASTHNQALSALRCLYAMRST